MSRYTLASFKKDLKTRDLLFRPISSFSGMTDSVELVDSTPELVDKSKLDFKNFHSFGIAGFWLVGEGRDYFRVSDSKIEVINYCGSSEFIFC